MKIQHLNRLFLAMTCICSVALLISLLAQIIFDHQPCFLCNIQRGCYVTIAIVALSGYLFQRKKSLFQFLLGLFPISATVSAYHLFVQYGIFKDFCTHHSSIKAEDFDLILSQPTASVLHSCATKSLTLLGQPLSFYNLVFFVTASILLFSKKASYV